MKKNSKNPVEETARSVIQFPSRLLRPIGDFLAQQVARLEKRVGDIAKEDPFIDTKRLTDNASPDSDAAEQFGHARVSAIKGELERKITQTRKALVRLKAGKYGICESCGQLIDTDRLTIYPEATLCIACEKKREK